MKVFIQYWDDFDKRKIETDGHFPLRLEIFDIETIQSHISLVEVGLPIHDDEVFITIPRGTEIQFIHDTLVLR